VETPNYERVETTDGILHRFTDDEGKVNVMVERDGKVVPYSAFLEKPTRARLPQSVRAADVILFEDEVVEPEPEPEMTDPPEQTMPSMKFNAPPPPPPELPPELPVVEQNGLVIRIPTSTVGILGGVGIGAGLTLLLQHLT
jgi:hypothetical protein